MYVSLERWREGKCCCLCSVDLIKTAKLDWYEVLYCVKLSSCCGWDTLAYSGPLGRAQVLAVLQHVVLPAGTCANPDPPLPSGLSPGPSFMMQACGFLLSALPWYKLVFLACSRPCFCHIVDPGCPTVRLSKPGH